MRTNLHSSSNRARRDLPRERCPFRGSIKHRIRISYRKETLELADGR